jgi:hypothetical protein
VLPNLDPDDQLMIPALEACGLSAEPRVWNDPAVDWNHYRVVVIWSTWDYSERRDAFLQWAASLPRVLNEVPVVAWNTDKTYLRALSASGVPIVPTTWVAAGASKRDLQLPAGNFVVKPAISSGAQNTARYGPEEREAARTHVERLLAEGREVMLQPYVPTVDDHGESGLIYFDGVFSHAMRKGALLRTPGVATDELWAKEDITSRIPQADEHAVAALVLGSLPWPRETLLYARVDLVRGNDGTPWLLELELAEPSLFLGLDSDAALRFAEGIARRIGDD